MWKQVTNITQKLLRLWCVNKFQDSTAMCMLHIHSLCEFSEREIFHFEIYFINNIRGSCSKQSPQFNIGGVR